MALFGGNQKTEQKQIPLTPFGGDDPTPPPDQCDPDKEKRQDATPSPVVQTEETPKETKGRKNKKRTPKEKPHPIYGVRVIPTEKWGEISARLAEEMEKRLRCVSLDEALRQHRAAIKQLQNRGLTPESIAEIFAGVFGFMVDAEDISRALKPKRAKKKKDAGESSGAENVIPVETAGAGETAEAIAQ